MRAPSPNPPDPDDAHASRAEEVRAYLVALRGGAPFLSGADGRLLVKWLDAGIPVPLILTALDRVAARRAARRQRSRLTLNAARKEVEGLWGMPEARPAPAVAAETAAALLAWADAVAAGGAAVAGLVSAAQQRIAAGGEVEGLLEDLASACRRFHDAQWEADPDRRESLLEAARSALAPLQDKVSFAVFQDLVDETARGQLRASWPLVNAAELWDRVAVSRAVEP